MNVETTMKVILFIMSMVAYVLTSWMAISAYFTQRRVEKNTRGMSVVVLKTLMHVYAMTIRKNMEEIRELHKALKVCAEKEDFEAAQRLKEAIEAQEKNVNDSIDAFNHEFSDMAEIKMSKIK